MSSTSVLYQHRVIHRALEMAVKWQLVYRNVSDAVEAPRKAEYEFSIADSDTKNRQGRSIPLPNFLADLLKRHKAEQNELRIAGLKNELDLVFIWPDSGRPVDPDYLSRVFIQRTCRKLGIENLRLHDLRHSFATLLLNRKVHPKVVQEILGHSSISLTLDTYSHVLPSMKEDVADILNNEALKSGSV